MQLIPVAGNGPCIGPVYACMHAHVCVCACYLTEWGQLLALGCATPAQDRGIWPPVVFQAIQKKCCKGSVANSVSVAGQGSQNLCRLQSTVVYNQDVWRCTCLMCAEGGDQLVMPQASESEVRYQGDNASPPCLVPSQDLGFHQHMLPLHYTFADKEHSSCGNLTQQSRSP